MILAGDCGGTKTELALFENADGGFKKIFSQKYFNKNFSSLEEIISAFLLNSHDVKDKNQTYKIDSACIGIAGPVIDGRAILTNLNWQPDERTLSGKLNIKNFILANDLEIIANAVPLLTDQDLITLYKRDNQETGKNKVILAPGTGLGQAALVNLDGAQIVIATEGGHSDFAPSDEIETELLKYLKNKFGHVSYERIASGMGLINIFNFLKEINYTEVSEEILSRIDNEDAAAVISEEGLNNKNEIFAKALDIFSSVLGAQAGNMVLNFKATGGVYLGGGIPIKIIEKLKDGSFLKSFFNKGRLSYLTEMTPVFVISDPSAGLTGAAIIASKKFS